MVSIWLLNQNFNEIYTYQIYITEHEIYISQIYITEHERNLHLSNLHHRTWEIYTSQIYITEHEIYTIQIYNIGCLKPHKF